MKVLITNDDSISSACLLPLAQWVTRRLGDVTVVAPQFEQSGKSHAIDIHAPFEVKKSDVLPGIDAYTVDSTPADCVRMALLGMHMEPDLIISGINRGYNMGHDILYSGTAGAVFEAALFGYNAMALSTDFHTFDSAIANLDRVWDFFCEKELFSLHNLYNVNIPIDPKGILMTHQGGPFYTDTFEALENDMYIARGCLAHKHEHDLSIDTDAVVDGFISVSPLTPDRTAWSIYDRVKDMKG